LGAARNTWDEDMLTTTQAAEQLNIKRGTVIQYIERGLLKASKTGRDWFIRQSEVNRYSRKRKGPGRPKTR
jgi:excisionase family DNA binding protein